MHGFLHVAQTQEQRKPARANGGNAADACTDNSGVALRVKRPQAGTLVTGRTAGQQANWDYRGGT